MVEIGARVVLTGVTGAALLDRREGSPINAGRHVEAPMRGIESSVSRDPRRRYAIEGIGTRGNSREEVLRLTDTEKVTRLSFGQFLAHPTHDVCHPLFLYGTTDAEPVERQSGDI